MDFRDILGQLHGIIDEGKMADIKGKKHTGKYGTDHDTDEEGEEKKRGGQESDATKDSKKWQGAADAAKIVSGGKKSSLKDWVDSAEEMIAERAKNKYAIGMAAAKKEAGYGSEPAHDLPKKVIKKGHEIAKKIKEEVDTGEYDARKSTPSSKEKNDEVFKKHRERVKNLDKDKQQGVAEGKADPTGSWVVHDGSKVKRFKTRDGAKAYAEKNGGKVASSEHYADKIQKKDVAEGEQRMSRAAKGNEKYGKDGMKALAKAGREGASEKELDAIRNKHDRYDESIDEAELKGGQKKLDKNHNGKLDSQDFKMLRKTKVKEGVNFSEMMNEKQQKVDEMLEELQQEIAEFKATGHMGDKLRDALDIHTYSKGETLIGEENDAIGDAIRHSQDVQHDKDMAKSDLYRTQDMSRLGDEGRADARHMKDISDLHDQSTADLWRIQDLARDKAMSSPSQKSNGQSFPLKPELDENPFSYAAKQAKQHGDDSFSLGGKTFPVKESDEPRLKTTKTDAGSETTSNTGRIKATFEPGKETKVEPVKEASKSYTDDMGPASGYTDEEMKAMDRATTKAQEANRKESERQAKNVWDPSMGSPKTPGDPVGLPKKSVKESMAYDVWNHQIEKMINESLTVSTTQSDQGDDSVSVTASGEDAADILALLRNAGLGGMGPTEHKEEPEQQFSNYGVPISAEHHDADIANHGKPPAVVMSAGDEMSELMQALSSIASEEGSDYADEEVDEGNAFTGALHNTPKGGEFEVDGKKYTDNSSLEEEMCQECGVYESGCECDEGHEMVDEEDEQPAGATAPAGQAAMSYAGGQAGASSAPAAAEPPSSGVEAMKTGIAAGSPAIAGAAPADNMQNAAATMKAAQGGASPTASAQAGTDASAQAQKQADQNKAGSEMGAGYAKAAAGPANPAASNAAMSAMTGGASVPKGNTTAAMPASQVAASSVAPTVKTGTGGTLTDRSGNPVRSRSADEIANTGPMGIQKPTAADKAAGDKTLQSVKNFFGFGKPAATAAAPASSNAAAAMASKSAAPKTQTPAGQVMAEEEVEENLESARPVEEELSNGADDRATQDIDFITRVISGGLNKEKVQHKHGYQFADNPLAMKESKVHSANDLLHDYRKLSGLE